MQCTTEVAEKLRVEQEPVQSLYTVFQQVADQRHKRGRRYEAATVLVILLLAKLSGEQTLSGVAEWARLRTAWLCERLPLKRLPCANTYAYICAHLDAVELNRELGDHFARLGLPLQPGELLHWAIDGKVLRGSHRQTPVAQGGQEVLGVYAVAQGYLEHCQPIVSKGYEAATAQKFVAQRECAGKVITADALHTRPRFCRQIRRQHGDYLLVVKRNRPQVEAEIRQLFALPPDANYPVQQVRTVDAGHGRLTIRKLSASCELNLALAAEWCDVAQVFLLERWVTRNGHTTYESVCGLTSLPPEKASPAQLLALVRAHWRIENRCHWRRDATLGEDACTVRHHSIATVLAVLNSAILALFDQRKLTNARSAIRNFAANPDLALALLI